LRGYERVDPLAARWKPRMGYSDYVHYRGLIDLMVNDDVILRSYEDSRDITPF